MEKRKIIRNVLDSEFWKEFFEKKKEKVKVDNLFGGPYIFEEKVENWFGKILLIYLYKIKFKNKK